MPEGAAAAHGAAIGVAPQDIPVVNAVDAPTDVDAERRFRTVAADWIYDCYGDDVAHRDWFVWKDHWRRTPYDALAKAFSSDELIRLWYDAVLASDIDAHIDNNEPLIWKVRNSLWRYGCGTDYSQFVAGLAGLRRLHVDIPGFELRVTHTKSINTAGWALHGRDNPIYLDASFGVLLFYKGEHVMTISFALSAHGILIAQVQLRQKRGNRFLYKLPMPFLDFGIDLVRRAFPDDPVYLVTGESTTEAIRRAYVDQHARFTDDVAERVQRFYDQPLVDHRRGTEIVHCGSDDGRAFVQLIDDVRVAA